MLWGGMDFLPLFKAEEFYKRKDKGQLSGADDNLPSERWCPRYALGATEDKEAGLKVPKMSRKVDFEEDALSLGGPR